MSVEAFVLAAAVEEGSPKKLFEAGITREDFSMYDEEFDWLVAQLENRRPINWRRFQSEFPDFERVVSDERLQDLCQELKSESAYNSLVSVIEQVSDDLKPDNAVEQASTLLEIVQGIVRSHSPITDVFLSDHKKYLSQMKELMLLRENGHIPGIPTGIKTLDLHWGGLQNGRTVLVLGRPGDAKSFFIASLCTSAYMDGRRGGLFSPEMNEAEHRARLATLLSANPNVQEELGLKKAFRNRALLDGRGFNYKTLKRFWEWFGEQQGDILLFNQTWRRQKMTPAYIEAKIDDAGLEYIIVDPLYKMKSGARGMKGWEELAHTTDLICDIAESHNIPVVMSNQANRQQGNRGDAPHKDSSFNGDNPVQEADHVVGVKYISEERKLILRCTKNRHGQDFRVDVLFVPNIGKIEDISFRDHNYYNGHEDGSGDDLKKHIEELEKEADKERS